MNILRTGSKAAILILIILLLGLLGYAIFGNRIHETTSPIVGMEAPPFTLELFNGQTVELSDLRGKTVVLNFWASWCMPCREEAPALEKTWLRYRNSNVVFLGVNIWDEKSGAMAFHSKYGGSYNHGSDPNEEIQVDYGIGGVPETLFINPRGIITDKYNGPLTEEMLDYYIERATAPDYSS